MEDVICGYKVAALLDQYVQGSRLWLYKRVEQWLDSTVAGSSATCPSIMALLAGPGMGKSVFGAVMQAKVTARTRKDTIVLVSGANMVTFSFAV